MEHLPHPLLGRERGVVREARGLGSVAHGLPEDGDGPEDLPRPFVNPSPNGVLDLVGQAEQERAFRCRVFFGLDLRRGFLPQRLDRLVLQRKHCVGILLPQQINRPRMAQAAEPTAKRLPRVVAEGAHPSRQVDPDPLGKLIGVLGAEPISAAGEPDHRVITRDEIDPRFVIAPVAEAVQERRIGRARIVADHRCDLGSGAAIRTWSPRAALIPFVLLYGEA